MLHRIGASIRAWWSQDSFRWGLALMAFSVLERITILLCYQPIEYSDTNAYLRLAKPISRLSLKGYDGTRVPGYPALLALGGLDDQRVWLLQLGLGLAITWLLFWITWKTTNRAAVGALVGGLYNLIPGQFLFESNLLSETLTTFSVLIGAALLVVFRRRETISGKWFMALCLGVAASLPGMVRPYFFPLTLWYLPFVWIFAGGNWKQRLSSLALYCLGPLAIQGGWLLWIRDHYHMISPTVMGGYSLVQHTGEFFELLPDDVAPIRDTYLIFRDAQIAERGVQTNAIWEAIPAMSDASGLGFYDLSRTLQRLSIQLIRAHPDLYLRNVIAGWIDFWKAPVYWRPSAVEASMVRSVLQISVVIGRGLSILANAAFLLFTALAILSSTWRRKIGIDALWVAYTGMIWLTSIVQTLVDHGDNPRFLVPIQVLVFYVVIQSIVSWRQNLASTEAM